MADYSRTTWVDDDGTYLVGTAITAARMNAIEYGIEDAAEHNQAGNLSSRPAAASGNKNWLYFATDTGQLFRSDGSAWSEISGHEAKAGLSYGTGWGNFGGAYSNGTYYKHAGRVFLDGAVKRSSGSSTTIATLPSGYRPPGPVGLAIVVFGGIEQVSITTGGVMTSSGSVGATAITLLDGASFAL